MDKLIFLDIDGVLNSENYLIGCAPFTLDPSGNLVTNGKSLTGMDKSAVELLVKIINQTNCKIVVSSAWRINGIDSNSRFASCLRDCDPNNIVIDSVIGRTAYGREIPDNCICRGDEIQYWINENNYTGKFVIIDDSSDMNHLKKHLVKTNYKDGLTLELANRVIEILNG